MTLKELLLELAVPVIGKVDPQHGIVNLVKTQPYIEDLAKLVKNLEADKTDVDASKTKAILSVKANEFKEICIILMNYINSLKK